MQVCAGELQLGASIWTRLAGHNLLQGAMAEPHVVAYLASLGTLHLVACLMQVLAGLHAAHRVRLDLQARALRSAVFWYDTAAHNGMIGSACLQACLEGSELPGKQGNWRASAERCQDAWVSAEGESSSTFGLQQCSTCAADRRHTI